MRDSKLIKTLHKLTADELKSFREYVLSPYFNKHERLKQLVCILVKASPAFEDAALEKEQMFSALFPAERYNSQKVSDLFTYLYRLLEDFLAQQQYDITRQNPVTDPLLPQLRTHSLNHAFEKRLEKLKAEQAVLESDELCLRQYHLEKESDKYFISLDSRTNDRSIERKTQALDRLYLVTKLRSCCEMINRQNIISEQYRIDLLEETMQMAESNIDGYADLPHIAIYLTILKTLRESDNEEHYRQLTHLLREHLEAVHMDELRTMYDYAQNYCIKKINTGRKEYLNEIFELYKTLLETGVIFIEGELSQWDYKNIVTTGSRLGQYDWVERFIEQYKTYLPAAEQENAYNFNLATLYYTKRDFTKAMRLLQTVQFTDLYYGLGARSLLLKIYYEAGESEPLYSLCVAFKTYLKRNKLVSDYQYRAHMNLVKLTKKLTDIKVRSMSSRKETILKDTGKLQARIKTAGDITNAAWLQERISELT